MYRTCEQCGRPFKRERSRQTKCPQHEQRGRHGRSPSTQAQDADYRRERDRTLAGDPPCHWCGRPHADTADHLVPVAAGGGHEGNLVPACSPCNLSRSDNPAWQPPARYGQPTVIVAVVGMVAVGKTTLIRQLLSRTLMWDTMSIDAERDDAGDWATLAWKVDHISRPTMIESVAMPTAYRRALDRHDVSVLHVTCSERERYRRMQHRAELGTRAYETSGWPRETTVDTTRPLPTAELDRLVGWLVESLDHMGGRSITA